GESEGCQSVEHHRHAPMPFRQRAEPAGQAAKGAILSGEPVKAAERPRRMIRRSCEIQDREKQRGTCGANHKVSTERGSKPTISPYATVMAARVNGMVTKTPIPQQSAPRMFRPIMASRNMVKPK